MTTTIEFPILDGYLTKASPEPALLFHIAAEEVLRIESDGRIFWRGREVESDDVFRAAMMDLRNMMATSMGNGR